MHSVLVPRSGAQACPESQSEREVALPDVRAPRISFPARFRILAPKRAQIRNLRANPRSRTVAEQELHFGLISADSELNSGVSRENLAPGVKNR